MSALPPSTAGEGDEDANEPPPPPAPDESPPPYEAYDGEPMGDVPYDNTYDDHSSLPEGETPGVQTPGAAGAPEISAEGAIAAANDLAPNPANAEGESFFAIDKELPTNPHLEIALLGGLMLDNAKIEELPDIFPPAVFSVPAHVRIFEIVRKLHLRRQSAHPATIAPYLVNDTAFNEAGGIGYLNKMVTNVISLSQLGQFALRLRDLHLKRELVRVGDKLCTDALNHDKTGEELIDETEKSMYELSVNNELGTTILDFEQTMRETLQRLQELSEGDVAAETGFERLDELLGGGMQQTDLIVLAGRPGAGKTAFSINLAQAIAERAVDRGEYALYFSMEMPATQIGMRMLATKTGIDNKQLQKDISDPERGQKILDAASELASLHLLIDESPVHDVATIRRSLRRASSLYGKLAIVFVDYLQLVRSVGAKRTDSKVYEIADITRSIKAMAREFKVPIVLNAQLSREVERRTSSEPQLSDLRDSGAIEQDADIVMLLYRYDLAILRQINELRARDENDVRLQALQEQFDKATNKSILKIAKHRNGPVGSIGLIFQDHLTQFSEDPDFADDRGGTQHAPPPPPRAQSSYAPNAAGTDDEASPF